MMNFDCWKKSFAALAVLLGSFSPATGQTQTVGYGYDAAGRLISVDYGGGASIAYTYDPAGNLLRRAVTSNATFASVSSASFTPGAALASEVIASGFGVGLASQTVVANTLPLPTTLAGTSVAVTDSQGVTRPALLFFVSAGQINYLIPAGTALGTATVQVTSGAGGAISGVVEIEAVSPALYAANSAGSGVAAAFFLRVAGDASRTQDLIYDPNTAQAVPVSLGAEDDQVFLLLFGTGMRNLTGQATATVGGEAVGVAGPVAQGQFVGLDQVNLGPLPRTLIGRGEVQIVLIVDGKAANTVTVTIQ